MELGEERGIMDFGKMSGRQELMRTSFMMSNELVVLGLCPMMRQSQMGERPVELRYQEMSWRFRF
jgi:hypothetical protein